MCVENISENIPSNLISNHIIGTSDKIIKTLQLCFRVFWFSYDFITKSMPNHHNLKFSADPQHKMWEYHFNLKQADVVIFPTMSCEKIGNLYLVCKQLEKTMFMLQLLLIW